MTKIYIVRHGQSKANELNLFLGHGNMDLTEIGKSQAQKTADFLSAKHIDKIYSSDLTRAFQTATFTANKKGLEVIADTGLREIDAGEWDFLSFAEIKKRYPEEFLLWQDNLGRAFCTNGETVLQTQDRIFNAIKNIAEQNPNKTVAVFSHATSILSFVAKIKGFDVDEIKNLPYPSNASVTTVEYSDGKFTLIRYGEDGFMGEMRTALPENLE